MYSDDLQVTASANCCLSAELKAIGKDDFRLIPAGVNGVEDRMSIVWEKGVVSDRLENEYYMRCYSPKWQ